jgi:hypothetical protein
MTRMSRRLLALPLVLALMFAPSALAVETGTSGYNQTPPAPSSGSGPSKETSKPATSTSPSTSSAAPSTSVSPSQAKTLPFTGLDLRWIMGVGVLLIGAGLSLRMVTRRERHDLGH